MKIGRTNGRLSRGKMGASAKSGFNGLIERLEIRQLLSGHITSLPISGANASAWSGSNVHIVAGPDGNMWFTDPGDDAIGRMTPDGVSTLFPVQLNYIEATPVVSGPTDIVVGPDHNLWFTVAEGNVIGRISTDGHITEFNLPPEDGPPVGLMIGPDGKVWFGESGSGKIAEISSDGTISHPYGALSIDDLGDGLVVGADGNVWCLSVGGTQINRITGDGTVQGFALNDTATSIGSDPHGNIWVGTSGGLINCVWVNNPGGPFVGPHVGEVGPITSMELGNDGSLYFTAAGTTYTQAPWVSQFGKISDVTTFTDYRLPNTATDIFSATAISSMAQDSNGVFWFVDRSSPRLIRWNMNTTVALTMNGMYVPANVSTTSTVATFTDSAGSADPSDYTITATLFDGSVIPATVAANGDGSFSINVTHTWTAAWDQWLTISVDDHTDTWPVTHTGYVSAYSNEPTGATGVNVNADTSQIFTGTVAEFTGLPSDLSAYRAIINWGDGQTDFNLLPTIGADGIARLIGSHIYTEPGTYTVVATLVSETSGWIQSGQITSSLSDPSTESTATVTGIHRLPFSGTGENFSTDTSETFSGIVAHYSDVDLSSLSSYSAMIEWGDGSQSPGTITANDQGGIDVAGSHQYTYAGSYGVTVALADSYSGWSDPSGKLIVSQPVARPTATVTGLENPNPPPTIMPIGMPVYSPGTGLGMISPIYVIGKDPIPVSDASPNENVVAKAVHATAVKPFKVTLGILKGIRHLGKLSALNGEINWGDGSTSPATFVRLGHHRVAVRGAHDYAVTGSFQLSFSGTDIPYVHGKPQDTHVSLPVINTTASIGEAVSAARKKHPR